MSVLNIPNTDERQLDVYRQFYFSYPRALKFISSDFQIWQSLTAGFKEKNIENSMNPFRGSFTPELEIHDSHYINLFKEISYTHFVELIRVENPLKRLFYELESIKGTWSDKELKRQIGSLLYERTGAIR